MEAICLLYFGRYKVVCVRGGFIESLERECCKFTNFICYKDMKFSSLENSPSPHVLDYNGESMCKPWEGIVMCLCDVVCSLR